MNSTLIIRLSLFAAFVFACIVLYSCSQSPTNPENSAANPYQFIRGRLLLENQTNHSHCPLVLDSINIGTISDSTGYFEIFLPDSMFELSGTFQIYCYLYDYGLDSFTVHIENGQLIWGKGDVSEDGHLQTKTMKQLFSLTVSTGKKNYLVNDPIELTIQLNNTSNNALWINGSTIAMLGFYDVGTKESGWILTQDPTGEMIIVEPDSFIYDFVTTSRKEKGNGYLIPFYSIRDNLPNSLTSFLSELENNYESAVYAGGLFFVFINASKNLNFPFIQVIGN